MSLQATSALIPNRMVDERKRNVTRSQRRLSQLTEIAVEKALKLQAESARLVEVVDTQSCRESGDRGCLYAFSLFTLKLSKNTAMPSSSSQKLALSKDSEYRRSISDRIYALLVQWRPDFSFEWRARVAHAAPVFEEALYRKASSKEDYTSRQHLEVHLKQVLLHFEAGHGLFLLHGISPLYPMRTNGLNGSRSTGRHVVGRDTSAAKGPFHNIHHQHRLTETISMIHANDLLDSRSEPESCFTNCPLGDAIELEMGQQKHADNSKVNIQKRLFKMLSTRRMDDNVPFKNAFERDFQIEEKFARFFAKAKKKILEVTSEVGACEPSQSQQRGSCRRDVGPGRSPRKTLGDMFSLGISSELASGGSIRGNIDEASPGICNERISQDSPLQTHPGSMEIEEIRPLCLVCCENRSMEPILDRRKGQDLVQPDPNEIMECLLVCSSSSSSSSSSPLMLSASTSPLALTPPREHGVVPLSLPDPMTAFAPIGPSTSTISEMPEKLGPSPMPASVHHKAVRPHPSSSSTLVEMDPFQRQQASASSSRQPPELFVIAADSAGIQASNTTALGQQTEPVRLSSSLSISSASSDSPVHTAHRGIRLPLSIFLAERDEYIMNHMSGTSDRQAHPWDKWEEPTEQIEPLCCVCMVGLKGAAFIPCGHIFCRSCSRELWRGRGACPLCNRYISEILDVY